MVCVFLAPVLFLDEYLGKESVRHSETRQDKFGFIHGPGCSGSFLSALCFRLPMAAAPTEPGVPAWARQHPHVIAQSCMCSIKV